MALPISKAKALLADKVYDGDAVRANLLMRDILPIIPPKGQPPRTHCLRLASIPRRNRIKRMIGHLKHQRRIATRYLKTALSFASFLNLAAIRRWLPNFVNRT
jgi:transposase